MTGTHRRTPVRGELSIFKPKAKNSKTNTLSNAQKQLYSNIHGEKWLSQTRWTESCGDRSTSFVMATESQQKLHRLGSKVIPLLVRTSYHRIRNLGKFIIPLLYEQPCHLSACFFFTGVLSQSVVAVMPSCNAQHF